MIKKIYAKLGTGMTLQPIRSEQTPRTYLLESQQQPTDTVPAVSPVAEAHFSAIPFADEVDFNNLMGLFKLLGGLADRSPEWHTTFVFILSKYMAPEKNVFKAPLYVVLNALCDTQDYFAAQYLSGFNHQ